MMLTMPLQPSDLRLFPGYFQRPAAGGPAPVALDDDIDRDLNPQPHGERCLAELVESRYKWIPCRILLKECALNSLEAFTMVCRTACLYIVKLAGMAQPLESWDTVSASPAKTRPFQLGIANSSLHGEYVYRDRSHEPMFTALIFCQSTTSSSRQSKPRFRPKTVDPRVAISQGPWRLRPRASASFKSKMLNTPVADTQ